MGPTLAVISQHGGHWETGCARGCDDPREVRASTSPTLTAPPARASALHSWYAVYLSLLPLTFSTGYFCRLRSILRHAAAARSTPQRSDSRTRYNSTSDNSSPKCTLSASFQSARPGGHSPRHWKISASSPTSPIRASTRFRGVWNCSHCRSAANANMARRIASRLMLGSKLVPPSGWPGPMAVPTVVLEKSLMLLNRRDRVTHASEILQFVTGRVSLLLSTITCQFGCVVKVKLCICPNCPSLFRTHSVCAKHSMQCRDGRLCNSQLCRNSVLSAAARCLRTAFEGRRQLRFTPLCETFEPGCAAWLSPLLRLRC